jgi:hypothetical protein
MAGSSTIVSLPVWSEVVDIPLHWGFGLDETAEDGDDDDISTTQSRLNYAHKKIRFSTQSCCAFMVEVRGRRKCSLGVG